MKTYQINEMFYSIQGEGMRAGTANIFIRFSGCNMKCAVQPGEKSPGGFDCDTEFVSGRKMTKEQILQICCDMAPKCRWVILTGGEPAMQVDAELLEYFRDAGYQIAIETNGSLELAATPGVGHEHGRLRYSLFDWITVSPKVAEHCIRQLFADELRYVRGSQSAIPRPTCEASHYLLSPAFNGKDLDKASLARVIELVKENPDWRVSVQQHKFWEVE